MNSDAFKNSLPDNRTGLLAISMGCPVGVGPEIVLRFLAKRNLPEKCLPVVIGDMAVLKRCAKELQTGLEINAWQPGNAVDADKVNVFQPGKSNIYFLDSENLKWGLPDRETGRAAAAYIEEAVQLIGQGKVDGLVTCPISKQALHLGGYKFPGHTEMLAALCNTRNFGMMMAGSRLKVSLVTIHTPLGSVAGQLEKSEIRRIIELTAETLLQDFALAKPRIGVAGFNPHAGESGLFGHEEEQIIAPAVHDSFSEKWEIAGPLPPDTVFKMAYDGRFDAVVAMYHDQGLIPFKMVHFEDGVNLTMGLPMVRTSVDHGTAYDIAGKGVASAASLEAAFHMAAALVDNRQRLKKA